MRSVSSAYWAALQADSVNIAEIIDFSTIIGTFRWTTSNQNLTVNGIEYIPFPGGTDGGIEESTDLGIGTINFTLVNSTNLQKLVDANALDTAEVTISRVFVQTPSLGAMVIFHGTVGDHSYSRQAISGQIRNTYDGIAHQFPRYTYQDTCVWRFGSTGCGVSTSSHTVVGSLNVGSSTSLTLSVSPGTLSSFSPGYMERGKLTITSGVNSGVVRTIRTHSGDVIGLSHSVPYTWTGSADTFSIYPGCRKRLVDDCTSKYNNVTRFLGFPWMPRNERAY